MKNELSNRELDILTQNDLCNWDTESTNEERKMNGDMLKEYVDGLSEAKRDQFFMLLAYAFEEWSDEYALEEQRIYEEFATSFSNFKNFIESE